MSILNADQSSPYKKISIRCLNDSRLSWSARGLHAYVMTRPRYTLSVDDLLAISTASRDVLRSALKELELFGYLKMKRDTGIATFLEWPSVPKDKDSKNSTKRNQQ